MLIKLYYESSQREADFRYALIRIRGADILYTVLRPIVSPCSLSHLPPVQRIKENAESIAFYGGEAVEERETKIRFCRVIDNKTALNNAEVRLDIFTTMYNHLVNIFPTFLLANQYFLGFIEFGVIGQAKGAFEHVLGDFSVIIKEFSALAGFMARIDRLFLFMKAVRIYVAFWLCCHKSHSIVRASFRFKTLTLTDLMMMRW